MYDAIQRTDGGVCKPTFKEIIRKPQSVSAQYTCKRLLKGKVRVNIHLNIHLNLEHTNLAGEV